MRLGTHFHLTLRLSVFEAIHLVLRTALWQAEGHLYFYFTVHIVSTDSLCTGFFLFGG
jgi:hypothetical protein